MGFEFWRKRKQEQQGGRDLKPAPKPTVPKSWGRKIRFVLLIVAIVALVRLGMQVVAGHGGGAGQAGGQAPGAEQEQQQQKVPVRVFKVARTLFQDKLPVMGTVTGISELELKFEVSGIVSAFAVNAGDLVAAGDVMAQLEPRDAQLKIKYAESKLEAAKASCDAAQVKLKMHESLAEIGAIVPVKLDEVKAETAVAFRQMETSLVELESAKAELDKTVLKAPRDGVVTNRDIEVGEFATPQASVATLMEIHDVHVVLGIIEKDIERVTLGQPAKITVDTYPGTEFEGMIDEINPLVEGKGRTLPVKARVSNPDSRLLPGMFARAVITVFEQPDAIVVPSISLHRKDDGSYTAMVVQEETVAERPVTVGYITTDYAQVDDGLQEGELVVVESQATLKDGASVEVLEIQEASF